MTAALISISSRVVLLPPALLPVNRIHRGIGDGGRRAADHTGLRIQSQSCRKPGRHGVLRDGSATVAWHVRDDGHTSCVHHRGIAVAQPRGGGCWRRVAAVASAAASGHQQDKRDWQTTQAVSGMHRMVLGLAGPRKARGKSMLRVMTPRRTPPWRARCHRRK